MLVPAVEAALRSRLDLTPEHGDLMAQDQDLGISGPVGPDKQGEPAGHADHQRAAKALALVALARL